MIISKTVIITRAGDLRIARATPKAGKDELLATLEVEVPESAFQPPRLMLRATVVPTVNGRAVIEPPAPAPAAALARKPRPLVKDDGQPWTPNRVRGLMALLDIDRDALARLVGVSAPTVKRWETTGEVEAAFRDELATLEAEAKGVTA